MFDQSKIFVSNFPFSSTDDDLRAVFEKFGVITEITIPTDRESGRPRGFAFISFETTEAAQESLTMDGQDLGGRPLRVTIAKSKAKGEGRGGREQGRASSW